MTPTGRGKPTIAPWTIKGVVAAVALALTDIARALHRIADALALRDVARALHRIADAAEKEDPDA